MLARKSSCICSVLNARRHNGIQSTLWPTELAVNGKATHVVAADGGKALQLKQMLGRIFLRRCNHHVCRRQLIQPQCRAVSLHPLLSSCLRTRGPLCDLRHSSHPDVGPRTCGWWQERRATAGHRRTVSGSTCKSRKSTR